MRVLSLFDGISCGRVALTAADTPPSVYYASEVDKYAIAVAQANHPDTVQIGDVRVVRQMCEAGVFGHVDRINPDNGYTEENSQIVCLFYNLAKNNSEESVLWEMLEKAVDYKRGCKS